MAKKYIFQGEIKKELNRFESHLKSLGQNNNTITQKTNYVGLFMQWLEDERLNLKDVTYNDMAVFIDIQKSEEKSIGHINRIIMSARHYYEFLQKGEPSINNPAINLKIRSHRRKIPNNIIQFDTLDQLYANYKAACSRTKRNKAMLGLFIYQGITTEELHRLEPIHLNLKGGKIYIPGARQSNSRVLGIKPFQILELHEYVAEIRPKLLKTNTNQLILSMEGSTKLKNSLTNLFSMLRKQYPELKNAKQIRASAIVHWLKTNNLRQVQYMAGHKWVSSTEYYKMNYLEDLKRGLDKYHPLK